LGFGRDDVFGSAGACAPAGAAELASTRPVFTGVTVPDSVRSGTISSVGPVFNGVVVPDNVRSGALERTNNTRKKEIQAFIDLTNKLIFIILCVGFYFLFDYVVHVLQRPYRYLLLDIVSHWPEYKYNIPENLWPELEFLYYFLNDKTQSIERDYIEWQKRLRAYDTGSRLGQACRAGGNLDQAPFVLPGKDQICRARARLERDRRADAQEGVSARACVCPDVQTRASEQPGFGDKQSRVTFGLSEAQAREFVLALAEQCLEDRLKVQEELEG
jgi:hypothetical protein